MISILIYYVGVPIFVYLTLVKPFEYWVKRGVDSYRAWDVWTTFVQKLTQTTSTAETVQQLYNDFFCCRYGGSFQFYKPILVVKDPELINQITVEDSGHFVDHSQFLAGGNTLTSSNIKAMFGLISECSKQFVQYFEEQSQAIIDLKMKDAFLRFTNDVTASTVFGISCDSLRDQNNSFYLMRKKAVKSGLLYNLRVFFILKFPRFCNTLGLQILDSSVRDFFAETIKENIQIREGDGIIRPDMIHLLVQAKKQRLASEGTTQELHVADDDPTAQTFISFFAELDAVATSMSLASYELATNPYIQQRLQMEIDKTLANCRGLLTYDILSKMKYMDMVISESLRKWPVALFLSQICVKPYTIQPKNDEEYLVCLHEGQSVIVPIFGIHRDPQYYPEPNYFNPERFNEENKFNIQPCTYLPFGAGSKNRIVSRLALLELKLAFFHMLSKFDIIVTDKTIVPFKFMKNLAHTSFWMGLKPRKKLL